MSQPPFPTEADPLPDGDDEPGSDEPEMGDDLSPEFEEPATVRAAHPAHAHPLSVDLGLLLLRVGVGTSMAVFHGWPKLVGGPELWEKLGGAMNNFAALGLPEAPAAWGAAAMAAEFLGSLAILSGVLFRPAAAALAGTMIVAATHHLSLPAEADGAGWEGASHAIELATVYLALLLAGPGRFRPGARKR